MQARAIFEATASLLEEGIETMPEVMIPLVGNHSEYKKARDSRNELKNHEFPGPFVSAYNYGERISVQEALILSKQNWIP